jgi:type II secretory pathway pseudopilin PulG
MVELVITVVIIGIVSAIAVPRFSNAAQRAQTAALAESTAMFQRVLDRYAQEHSGLTPNHDAPGVTCDDATCFVNRLTRPTNDANAPDDAGPLGPYLGTIPLNPINNLRTVRVGGAAAGAGTHGWRFDAARNLIEPDHPASSATPANPPGPGNPGNQPPVVAIEGPEGQQSVASEGIPLE